MERVNDGTKSYLLGFQTTDSYTTEVTATLNCNYIPSDDLADVIYVLVKQYMPNAVVNVELNGVASQQISAYQVIGAFPGVNCYDYGSRAIFAAA